MKSLSCVQLFATPWPVAYQAPPSMKFSRQEYWSRFPFPSPGDLPDPGIEPWSPELQADTLPWIISCGIWRETLTTHDFPSSAPRCPCLFEVMTPTWARHACRYEPAILTDLRKTLHLSLWGLAFLQSKLMPFHTPLSFTDGAEVTIYITWSPGQIWICVPEVQTLSTFGTCPPFHEFALVSPFLS